MVLNFEPLLKNGRSWVFSPIVPPNAMSHLYHTPLGHLPYGVALFPSHQTEERAADESTTIGHL